jgi:hypothetical protein
MKRHTLKHPLKLNRETLRDLNSREVGKVLGGASANTCVATCHPASCNTACRASICIC